MFDFDLLTSHILTITPYVASESYVSAACHVTSVRGLYHNANGIFSTQHGRRYSFSPDGCTLAVIVGGVTYQAGPNFSDLLKNSDDSSEEIPFNVMPTADGYIMVSEDRADLNSIWATYGCADTDHLLISLHRV